MASGGPSPTRARGCIVNGMDATRRPWPDRLRARWRSGLAAACRRAGRARADVTLVAVTKTVSAEVAAVLCRAGRARPRREPAAGAVAQGRRAAARRALAPRSATSSATRSSARCRWSGASIPSTAFGCSRRWSAAAARRSVEVLLEVNARGEASKQGFAPGRGRRPGAALSGLRRVRVSRPDDDGRARRRPRGVPAHVRPAAASCATSCAPRSAMPTR